MENSITYTFCQAVRQVIVAIVELHIKQIFIYKTTTDKNRLLSTVHRIRSANTSSTKGSKTQVVKDVWFCM